MRGARLTFLYFWRVLVWLNLMCSPVQSNQTGLLCGSPSGPRVATCIRAVVSRRSVSPLPSVRSPPAGG